MECLLHIEIYEDQLRIFFTEDISKENMGAGEVLRLIRKFSDIGKILILLLGVPGRYGTLLFCLGSLLPPPVPRVRNAEGKVAIG